MTEGARRYRQFRRILRRGGFRELGARIKGAAAKRFLRINPVSEVRIADVLGADLTSAVHPPAVPLLVGEHMIINWIMVPPARGSGGHTTLFRLIRYLEKRGHQCRIYLYDVYEGDAKYYRSVIRSNYSDVAAPVHDIEDGLQVAHAHFATSWETAYPLFNSRTPGKRCYLVQDFEPWFYPAGAQSVLADNTYHMGFHAITAGKWLAQKLQSDYAMTADYFDFGCDTKTYHLAESGPRKGIVFYARPGAPRRAYEIGILALQLFADSHPQVEIHFYGEKVGSLPFEFIDHGLLTPSELNEIYNQCFAGLSLSMSNVSLVPHEMLAAGCIPVVNEAEHNRLVLDNPHVLYTSPNPHALAAALGQVVSQPRFQERARIASASVRSASWADAGRQVEQALLRTIYAACG
jgi:glycosyltransferase involved in cell wall biosynthesis